MATQSGGIWDESHIASRPASQHRKASPMNRSGAALPPVQFGTAVSRNPPSAALP